VLGGGSAQSSGGTAIFDSLTLHKAGTSYTLVASATGLTGATSTVFAVTPATASKLAFSVQPTNATPGASISPAVTVQVLDAFDKAPPSGVNVSVVLASSPSGATLNGFTTVAANSGTATFSTLSLAKAGAGYTLTATSTNLSAATSTSFTVVAAAPSKLAFVQ